MLINFFRVKLRNIGRERFRFLVEVLSLCLGLTCFLFTLSFVNHESNYDSFHANSEVVYRLTDPWGKPGSYTRPAIIPSPWAEAIKDHFQEVTNYVRVRKMLRFNPVIVAGNVSAFESNFIGVDSTFFDVFSFSLLKGNPSTALDDPSSIVLTQEKARKYFGDSDPLGKTILLDNVKEYNVTGVMKTIPSNSHMHFDFVIRIEPVPVTASVYSYFQIAPGANIELLEDKLSAYLKETFGSAYPTHEYVPRFQKLTDVHLKSSLDYEFEPNGNAIYIHLLLVIGIAALVISVFNYLNIMMAVATAKKVEWDIRRSLGGGRTQRILQLSVDAFVVCVVAVCVHILLVPVVFPVFGDISNVTTSWVRFLTDSIGPMMCWVLIIPLMTGAFVLLVTTGTEASTRRVPLDSGASTNAFRNSIVVMQLLVSMILLIGVFVIGDQVRFMRDKELGFNKDQVLVINGRVEGGLSSYSALIRDQFRGIAGVEQVSFAQTVPGDFGMASISYTVDGETDAAYPMTTNFVDQNYLKTLGVRLTDGRDFNALLASDSIAYIINDAALRKLNWQSIESRFIQSGIDDKIKGPVIGVMKDFHFESLHSEIEPMVLCINPLAWNKIIVSLDASDYQATIDKLVSSWKTIFPGYPFQFTFLDDQFEKLYDADKRLSLLFSCFTIIAIILTCTGVYGMVSVNTSRRIKEVAIRKTLGASVMGVVLLLLKTIMIMCLLAISIGGPIGWLFMEKWLANFAYSIEFPLISLASVGLLVIGVSALTSLLIVGRAARTSPIQVLRQL